MRFKEGDVVEFTVLYGNKAGKRQVVRVTDAWMQDSRAFTGGQYERYRYTVLSEKKNNDPWGLWSNVESSIPQNAQISVTGSVLYGDNNEV